MIKPAGQDAAPMVYGGDDRVFLGFVDLFANLRCAWRYDEPGEFTLRAPLRVINGGSTPLLPGMWLWVQGRREIFIVETVSIVDDDGRETLEASGRTASALLDRRSLPDNNIYTGTHGALVNAMCGMTFADPNRAFPGLTGDVDSGLGFMIDYNPPPVQLLEAVQDVCRAAGLGFETVFDPISRGLVFHVWKGDDHSGDGDAPLVIFDPDMDNLKDISYLDSLADYANVAYVRGETDADEDDPDNPGGSEKTEKVLAVLDSDDDGYNNLDAPPPAGYSRFEVNLKYTQTKTLDAYERMLALDGGGHGWTQDSDGNSTSTGWTDASGEPILIPVRLLTNPITGAAYEADMIEYAQAEFAKKRRKTELNGQIVTTNRVYRFGIDYNVGDIVLLRHKRWGVRFAGRIREVEENWDDGLYTCNITVGDSLPTISDRILEVRRQTP